MVEVYTRKGYVLPEPKFKVGDVVLVQHQSDATVFDVLPVGIIRKIIFYEPSYFYEIDPIMSLKHPVPNYNRTRFFPENKVMREANPTDLFIPGIRGLAVVSDETFSIPYYTSFFVDVDGYIVTQRKDSTVNIHSPNDFNKNGYNPYNETRIYTVIGSQGRMLWSRTQGGFKDNAGLETKEGVEQK